MLHFIHWIDRDLESILGSPLYEYYIDGNKLTEDEKRFYVTNKDLGFGIVLSDQLIINTIHLYGKNKNDIAPYAGEFPFNIDFAFTQNKVNTQLGSPYRTGGGHRNIYLGYIQPWDKYLFDRYSLHFQYSQDLTYIDLITIGSLSREPQLNSSLQ